MKYFSITTRNARSPPRGFRFFVCWCCSSSTADRHVFLAFRCRAPQTDLPSSGPEPQPDQTSLLAVKNQGNYFRFNLSPNLTLGLLLLLLHLHAARVTPQRVTVVGSRSSEKCGRPLVLDNYCICISLCNCKLLCFLAFAQKQLIIPKTARSTAERTDFYSACCLDHRSSAGWLGHCCHRVT